MKRMMSVLLSAMFVGSLALAADASNKENETVDTSKNPITGTKTTTHKYSRKIKDKNGDSGKMDVTEKSKVKKDGSRSDSVDVKAKTESESGK